MTINRKWKNYFHHKENIIIVLTLPSVVTGIMMGILLKYYVNLSERQIYILSFPGEMLMNALKMLIIPLIISSLITSLSGIDAKSGGKMGLLTVMYYVVTTMLALITGIILVTIIHPGNPSVKNKQIVTGGTARININTIDSFLDILRNLIPINIVEAYFQQSSTEYRTTARFALINGTNVTTYSRETVIVYRNSTNVLGLVMFSVTFGIILGQMGQSASVMINFFGRINDVVMKLITIVMWYSPIGIFFLILSRILEIDDLYETAAALGFFLMTVVIGLVIHAGFTLNLMFFLLTKRNPLRFFRGMLQAWITAIGTDSSSATLPITFRCLEDNNGISRKVTRFVLPIGATINMDGTALYEAVAAIFIAQINDFRLSFGQMFAMSITATLTAIGGSSVPSAGLITMILVINSVGLPLDDISLVLTLDWIIDRSRTSTNVLGDAFCAGIVDHFCKDEMKPSSLNDNNDENYYT